MIIDRVKLVDNKGVVHLEDTTEDVAWAYIKGYAKALNLGHYYKQTLLENGNTWIDYGSHTHFFYLHDDTTKDLM